MILLVPSAPVQNLRALNSSQFSVLIHWENITFVHQNTEILNYSLTTNFTNPNTKTPKLSSDFVRLNNTGRAINYFLLKNLWYESYFTVVVTPWTRLGAGPNASVTFMLDRGKYMLITKLIVVCIFDD